MLACANDLLISLGCDLFTTCCLLSLAPESGRLGIARAGHVPVVWGTDTGDSGVSSDEGGVPLGILPGRGYPVAHRRLTQAGYLVLLTDGVVEGPAFPIGEGLAEVARLAGAARGAGPDVLASRVRAPLRCGHAAGLGNPPDSPRFLRSRRVSCAAGRRDTS